MFSLAIFFLGHKWQYCRRKIQVPIKLAAKKWNINPRLHHRPAEDAPKMAVKIISIYFFFVFCQKSNKNKTNKIYIISNYLNKNSFWGSNKATCDKHDEHT